MQTFQYAKQLNYLERLFSCEYFSPKLQAIFNFKQAVETLWKNSKLEKLK